MGGNATATNGAFIQPFRALIAYACSYALRDLRLLPCVMTPRGNNAGFRTQGAEVLIRPGDKRASASR